MKEVHENGGFSYIPEPFDSVYVGFNADTQEYFVADNGNVELETTDTREFLNNFPLVMQQLEREWNE